jgi:hypothetical protein
VLNQVAAAVGEKANGRPVVDLVLNGHAHCLEHLQTGDIGQGDANINWIVCGGSGYSLRRQRQDGPELLEDWGAGKLHPVAKSLLFVGRNGQGLHKRRPYSFVRIDVTGDGVPKFTVRPYVAERYQHRWHEDQLPVFEV